MRLRTLFGVAGLMAAMVLGLGGIASAQEEGGEGEEPLSEASEECIHRVEETNDIDACQEAPSPILPAANEIIWGSISFVLLLAALYKFAWPGLRSSLQGRTERIRTSLEEAERAKAEATGVLEDYRRQLADARGESGRIIEEARQQADALRRDLQARAEAEAAEARQRNAEQVQAERDRVMAELQGQVSTLAIELAEKVVEGNLDRETNLRLIENYINTVGDGARTG